MGKKKKVAVIGTVGIPARYGGFETLAEQLVQNNDGSHDIIVYCTSVKYKKEDRKKYYKGARLYYLPIDANGVQSILYDSLSILHALLFADVLLVLGVAGAWLFPFVRLFTRKKIIVSIDGIEWKRDKWNLPARWYLWWAEGIAVRYSHIDISDNESIQDYTALRYNTLSNIIEYGGDHALNVDITANDIERHPFLNAPYAFKVCRIEPENNVHVVLHAFSQLPHYPFVMVGNWKNSEYGIQLRQEFEHYDHIHLLDPIYDQRNLDVLRSNCSLYIHGHSAGGTNPSLVEAMYLGLPIIAFGVSYNKTTTDNKAFYFYTSEDIQQLIHSKTPEDLTENARLMKKIADSRYTWEVVSNKYNFLVRKSLRLKRKKYVSPTLMQKNEGQLINMNLGHLKHQQLFYEKEKS